MPLPPPSPPTDPAERTAWCPSWGVLLPSERKHRDCPVIVAAVPLLVCPCECKACRRAWWAAGRPIVRDGAVVYGTAFPPDAPKPTT